MEQLFASDKAKFQFGIQYIFIFPPTNNSQRTIMFTSEIGTFEIENTFVFRALPLGFLLLWVLTAGACSAESWAGCGGAGCLWIRVRAPSPAAPEPFATQVLGSGLLHCVNQMCRQLWSEFCVNPPFPAIQNI